MRLAAVIVAACMTLAACSVPQAARPPASPSPVPSTPAPVVTYDRATVEACQQAKAAVFGADPTRALLAAHAARLAAWDSKEPALQRIARERSRSGNDVDADSEQVTVAAQEISAWCAREGARTAH